MGKTAIEKMASSCKYEKISTKNKEKITPK
jgi:hypothetical protein